jgi:thiaminase (transcriptional activator TenA)
MDAEGARLDPEARRAMKNLFRTSSRYEWMFWDMAWREEKWLP